MRAHVLMLVVLAGGFGGGRNVEVLQEPAAHHHAPQVESQGAKVEPEFDGRPGSVTGYVRDAACLMRNPAAGAPDDAEALDCAKRCVVGGSPIVVYTREGALVLVVSPGSPDRSESERLLPYVGKLVRATGRVFERAGVRAIAIEEIEVIEGAGT